ncbi:MAG: SLC13 family permease [Gemmatimonadota bacterium]
MTLDIAITLAVLAVTIAAISREVFGPDVLLAAALVAVLVTGVVDPATALEGFGNPALATVASMLVISAALRSTGALEGAGMRVFGKATTLPKALFRLTGFTAGLSAAVSNTAVVAMAMPVVQSWAKRARVSPSRLLIPLSYASILGGMTTVIGTSTNLVSDGLLRSSGLAGLGFFELSLVGVPAAIIGVLYLSLVAPRLLKDRVPVYESGADVRRYLAELKLTEPSTIIGKTVTEAGLRHLPGLFLVRIERRTGVISPVGPEIRLFAGDRLTFAGNVETIVDIRKLRGLVSEPDDAGTRSPGQPQAAGWSLNEAVVSPGSALVGSTIREANFRSRYNAAVVAVHRRRSQLTGRIGDIVLRPGDTLLLEAASGFTRTFRHSRDFYLVSHVVASTSPRHDKMPIALGILASVVLLAALNVLPIVTASMLGGIAMIALRCLSPGDAKRSIDWSVLLMIGSALGLAAALRTSGAADLLAAGIVGAAGGLGPVGVLAATFVATLILTEFVTNTAAVALMFPIALSAAASLGVDPRPFVVAATLAASLSMATPIGYHTNLMVYGPGGYSFGDFARVGIPLQIMVALLALFLIPIVWPLSPA